MGKLRLNWGRANPRSYGKDGTGADSRLPSLGFSPSAPARLHALYTHSTHCTHIGATYYICHTHNTHTSTPHTHHIHTLHITQEMLSKLRYTNTCIQTRFHRLADQLTHTYTYLERSRQTCGSMQTRARHAPEHLNTHADVFTYSQVLAHVKS